MGLQGKMRENLYSPGFFLAVETKQALVPYLITVPSCFSLQSPPGTQELRPGAEPTKAHSPHPISAPGSRSRCPSPVRLLSACGQSVPSLGSVLHLWAWR